MGFFPFGFCFVFVWLGVFWGGGGDGGGGGSLKRVTLSANLKFVWFSPSTLIPSQMSSFLETSSITAVNSLDESGSPCLTPLFIGNSLQTTLSK